MAQRKFKLNCLTILTPTNRILRSEDNETYSESVFGEQLEELLKAGKIVEVTKSSTSTKPKSSNKSQSGTGKDE